MILSFHRKSILHSSILTKFVWNKIEDKKINCHLEKEDSSRWVEVFRWGKLTGHQ